MKALSLDEDLSEARVALSFALSGYDRDFANAEAEFKRAIRSNPSDATAHHWYSLVLGWTGRLEEAKEEIKKALELNPLSLMINTIAGVYFYYEEKLDESISQLKRVVEMDPNFVLAYPGLIRSYLAKSMRSEALEALATYSRLDAPPQSKLWSAYVHAAMGNADEARRMLADIEGTYKEMHVGPYWIACIHFLIGDSEEGFRWLERAYDDYDRTLNLMTWDYELKGIRSDPRYLSLLGRMGLAPYFKDE